MNTTAMVLKIQYIKKALKHGDTRSLFASRNDRVRVSSDVNDQICIKILLAPGS